MSAIAALSPNTYYEEAKKMLEKKDLLEFISKISIAVELSLDDPEMLAKTTFLKAKGLKTFNQHAKVVDSVDEAIKHNNGLEAFELRELQATSKGYLGIFDEAIVTFKQLLIEVKDNTKLSKICVSLAWILLILDRENPKEKNLKEAKKYLDMANQYFNELPDFLKRKILNNFSVYYFYQGEYENAIRVLEKAFKYAQEKDLPKLYNNFAEVYLKFMEKSDLEISFVKDILNKAEIFATKYDDKIEMAFSYFTKAKFELLDEQVFKALDTLYLAFNLFIEVEAYPYSLECLLEINEIIKKLGQFMTNISKLELSPKISQKNPSNTMSLRTNSLFNFNRHKKLLEYVSQKLHHENNTEIMNLNIYEGVVYGYLGNIDKAVNIFKAIINQTNDQTIITTSYLNIAWLYLGLDKKSFENFKLEEAKKYLDLANKQFDVLPNSMKQKVLYNYSIFYCLNENYEKAIGVLENSIDYYEEKSLADLYNNIAELYLKSTDGNSFSEIASEYLEKAEVLGSKYNKTLSLGQTFYLKAEVEIREDQFFTALDTLYLAFEYFKQAEESVLACECLLKINELMDEYKQNNLISLKNKIKMGISNY